MNKVSPKNTDTREKLLQAAGEIFASKGFRGATVRDISFRAGVNVAAVNYHFGDKNSLYSAVLGYGLKSAIEKYPPDFGLKKCASPKKRLHAFIRSFLFRILDQGRPAWHGKLMAREIAEPTSALDELIKEVVTPLYERLLLIIRDIVGGNASDEAVRACAMSVMGQCLFYRHCRSIVARLDPRIFDNEAIESLADQITHFSICAIRGFKYK